MALDKALKEMPPRYHRSVAVRIDWIANRANVSVRLRESFWAPPKPARQPWTPLPNPQAGGLSHRVLVSRGSSQRCSRRELGLDAEAAGGQFRWRRELFFIHTSIIEHFFGRNQLKSLDSGQLYFRYHLIVNVMQIWESL